jgi:hypothetical protein
VAPGPAIATARVTAVGAGAGARSVTGADVSGYEAAAEEPDFPDDPPDLPDDESLLAGLFSDDEEPDDPSFDVFSFDEPADSFDEPVDSFDVPDSFGVPDDSDALASFDGPDSLAAGRLSFL